MASAETVSLVDLLLEKVTATPLRETSTVVVPAETLPWLMDYSGGPPPPHALHGMVVLPNTARGFSSSPHSSVCAARLVGPRIPRDRAAPEREGQAEDDEHGPDESGQRRIDIQDGHRRDWILAGL